MRVLVTNDDGVYAPGIAALARAAVDAGHDVVVAAPLDDRSGSGAGIGPTRAGEHITYEAVTVAGLEDTPTFGIEGPPALAVMVARLGAFGDPPELVLSGVNPGPNTGRATLHSGTVGAALTAANFGISGVAVSIGTGDHILWDTATRLALLAIDWIASGGSRVVLNINVPNVPVDQLAGVRRARLAPFGTVRAALADAGHGRLQIEFRDTSERLAPDTDTALVMAGFAAVTPLRGIRLEEAVDPVPFLLDALAIAG